MKLTVVAALLLLVVWPSARAEAARRWLVEGHVRYVTVPDFVASSLFREHTSMHGVSGGVAALWREPGAGEWWFALDYTPIAYAPGNWLEDHLPPPSAAFLDWDLGALSVAAGYTWRFELVARRLFAAIGAGAAFGVLIGDIHVTDVVPTCEEPVSSCPHWRSATRRALDLPTRVFAAPVVSGGLDARVAGPVWLRLEAGLYGIPFAGLSVAVRVH